MLNNISFPYDIQVSEKEISYQRRAGPLGVFPPLKSLPASKWRLLVVNTNNLTPPLFEDNVERAEYGRLRRWMLQAIARDVLPSERVSQCMRLFKPGQAEVKILYSDKFERAHYGGLTVCGSIWVCPICASKVSQRRKKELKLALLRCGDSVSRVMGTFTFQHSIDDSLMYTRSVLSEAFTRVKMGEPWRRFCGKYQIVGNISALECTYGAAGWHPHKHVLFISSRVLNGSDVADMREWISDRFIRKLEEKGRYASSEFGVDLRLSDDAGADYVDKWGDGAELTMANIKRAARVNGETIGFNPFELLELCGSGDMVAIDLFREYSAAMKGSHQLTYSKGLRAFLEMSEDKTDVEVASEELEESVLLGALSWSQWVVILKADKRGELLEVASGGNMARLEKWLNKYGLSLIEEQFQEVVQPA